MERDEVLKKLTALDFMAVDMALYLDTHPYDKEGIAIYNEILKEADSVRAIYEENFGPLCSYRSMSNGQITLGLGNNVLIINWKEKCANVDL